MKNNTEPENLPSDPQLTDKELRKGSPTSPIYELPITPDLRNLLWIGLIFLVVFLLMNLISPSPSTLPPPTQQEQAIIRWFTYISCGCVAIGLLFWRAAKLFIFDVDSQRLTINYKWLLISFKIHEIAFQDIQKFDLLFQKRRNAEYLTLLMHSGKSVLLELKRKKDDLNLHLKHLNAMLVELGGDQFPHASALGVLPHSISEDSSDDPLYFGTPGHPSPSRDMDHKITLSPSFLLIISPVLFLIPWLLTYAFYLFLTNSSTTDPISWLLLASCVLIALNYLWIVTFFFYGLKVKDMELERDHGKLGGDPLFIPPRIMTRLTDILKVTYIPPEKVPLYKNLRKFLLGMGGVPILASFLFFFM